MKEYDNLIRVLLILMFWVYANSMCGQDNVTISLSEAIGQKGEIVEVDMIVDATEPLASFFVTFEWDNSIANLAEVSFSNESVGLNMESDFSLNQNGNRINITWESIDEEKGTLISNLIMASFRFQLIGEENSETLLRLADNESTGQSIEAFIVENEGVFGNGALILSNGSLRIESGANNNDNPIFRLTNNRIEDEVVTLDLIAENLLDASSFQLIIEWDNTDMSLIDLSPLNLVGDENVSEIIDNMDRSRIIIEWTSDSNQGYTNSASILAQLSFRTLNTDFCSVSTVEFVNLDEDFQFLEYWVYRNDGFEEVSATYINGTFNFNEEIDLGPDIVKCANESVELTISLEGEPTWLFNNQPIMNSGRSISVLDPGVYSVILESQECSQVGEVQISNYQVAEQNIPEEIELIQGVANSDLFDLDDNLDYLWSASDNIELDCIDCNNPSIQADSLGFINVVITDLNGCQSFRSILVRIDDQEIEQLEAFISFRPPSCAGGNNGFADLLILGGLAPYEIIWSDGSAGINRSNLLEGEYSVMIRDASGQSTEVSALIRAQQQLSLSIDLSDSDCNNNGAISIQSANTVMLSTIEWSKPNLSGFSLNSLAAGQYSFEVIDEFGCAISDTLTLLDISETELSLGEDISICDQSDFRLFNMSNDNFDTYRWFSDDTLVGIGTGLLIESDGEYVLQASNAGCILVDTINVRFTPGLQFVPNDTFVLSGTLLEYQLDQVQSVSWGVLSGEFDFTCVDCSQPQITAISTGTIEANGTTSTGCIFNFEIEVKVRDNEPIDPINVITPNRDGFNDLLEFQGLSEYRAVSLIVINEWGRVITEIDNYQNNWDGSYKGEPLPDGVYFYRLNYSDESFDYVTSGDLLIIRN